MRLVLHRKVYADIDTIMTYYERVGGAELADDFYVESFGTIGDILHWALTADNRRLTTKKEAPHTA